MYGRLVTSLIVGVAIASLPLAASPSYMLTGSLQWNSASGADLINGNGKSFSMSVTISNLTPTPTPDPNGTRYDYTGTGILQIGSQIIALSSTDTAFFHSASHAGDVTNFFLFPASGQPALYLFTSLRDL